MTDSIGDLDDLLVLSFDHNVAAQVPPLDRLEKLMQLSMQGSAQGNFIRQLPESVGRLKQLTLLDLSGNMLTELPESLGNATALTRLFLDRNRLTRLPQSIGQLVQLDHLTLTRNSLESVPSGLGKLRNLQLLDLSENSLQVLPANGAMDSIQEARLQGNNLEVIPDWVVGPALLRLLIARNRISRLPALTSEVLALVDAENNSVTELPKDVP